LELEGFKPSQLFKTLGFILFFLKNDAVNYINTIHRPKTALREISQRQQPQIVIQFKRFSS